MISLAEPPIEYAPRGRAVVDEHSSATKQGKWPHMPSQNILLQRLRNVNISEKQVFKEFWSIRDIYKRCDSGPRKNKYFKEKDKDCSSKTTATTTGNEKPFAKVSDCQSEEEFVDLEAECNQVPKLVPNGININMYDFLVNSEEELYVKGHTAVWTKGLSDGRAALDQTCFTCETQIKFAFFYRNEFLCRNSSKPSANHEDKTTICLIDQNVLHVYSNNGERFLTNLQFPVSKVWPTRLGILLEKIASTTIIQNHTIMMPRLFSLTHPLEEICPVLNKPNSNNISYLVESEYQILFSDENCDLLLLYDKRQAKHFISRLRKANNEEINYISNQNDTGFMNTTHQYSMSKNPNLTNLHSVAAGSSYSSFTQNSLKRLSVTPKNNSGQQSRNALNIINQLKQMNSGVNEANSGTSTAFLGSLNSTQIGIKLGNTNTTPLCNLQSTIDQYSICMQDIRKCGQPQPSKPIAPEFCLEKIWMESGNDKRELNDVSSKVFLHFDIVGQVYICYLLPRSCKLQMILLNNYQSKHVQLATVPITLPAKDALPLPLMKMMAVLDSNGYIALYSGSVLASKVHVPHNGFLKNLSYHKMPPPTSATSNNLYTNNQNINSPSVTFPRRSSLLPTALQKPVNTFDDELHMLSPVQPLQSSVIKGSGETCIKIRDAAGNRFTMVYNSGKMLRVTLPLLNETKLVGRCLNALRYILTKEQYIQMIMRWYVSRNPPGSRNYDIEKEWSVFCGVILQFIGYDIISSDTNKTNTNKNFQHYNDIRYGLATTSGNSSVGGNDSKSKSSSEYVPKKKRPNDEIVCGTDEDWEYVSSIIGNKYCDTMNMEPAMDHTMEYCSHDIDTSAFLFNMIPSIFYCFHLLYEDMKLDDMMAPFVKPLATFLHQLSMDLNLSKYILHYLLDYPILAKNYPNKLTPTDQYISKMMHQDLLQMPVPCIYTQLENIIRNVDSMPYHYIDGINDLSRNVLQVISLIIRGKDKMKNWLKALVFENAMQTNQGKHLSRQIDEKKSRATQVIQLLLNMGITRDDIGRLPVTLHLIIADCLELARMHPPLGCSPATYELILRSELVAHATYEEKHSQNNSGSNKQFANNKKKQPPKCRIIESSFSDGCDVTQKNKPEDSLSARKSDSKKKSTEKEVIINDGMQHIDTKLLSLRFPDDLRICEVRKFLSSSEPMIIDIVQTTGTSDHDYLEEQEKQLFAMCIRTMALPFGRGMFTLRTMIPSNLKSVSIPKLNLSGKEPVKNTTIELQQIEFPANMSQWPLFHNGVAAGLHITPKNYDVDSTWIVYNKLKGTTDVSAEHAGFLMGLGLNGHLKNLSFMSIYEYLVKSDEMTSVGLLLGIAATNKGTMNSKTTKLLSVHIEALLPATALELDIPQNIQVASLMSIGLLYQRSAKRHIAEVLMQEVGRPPGPEMENCVERESYALTAGLALGLVTLGHGETPPDLRDLQLPDTLHYYMVGGSKRPLTGSQKEKYKLPSFQIREGDHVNIDVTAPGATLALGLMFFNTNNKAVAGWMKPPTTRYLLDLVRPDFLLLRTISYGLIMWSEIEATKKWFYGLLPENLRSDVENCFNTNENYKIDKEALTQAYCNVIAGAAFCIGLKYSGTQDRGAFAILRRAITDFMGYNSNYIGDYAGQSTIENCLMVLVLSISLVFAGSGDLETLRIIRFLRSRIGSHYSHVNYGSHMVIHMALGFLYLGAGRFTISQTPEAIGALVCALYPKFPNHSNDNRYHLQAFRHLYVLAVEPRLFLPRDIDTKQLSLCNLMVVEAGSYKKWRLPMAPCMLPKLDTLQKVIVDDPSYWTVSFEKKRNWDQLLKILENCDCIDIKKRSGCLSHLEDPDRLKSLYSLTLTMEQYKCWEVDVKVLENFSSKAHIINFIECFLHQIGVKDDYTENELKAIQFLRMLFYNPLIKDKMHVFSIYLTLYNIVERMRLRLSITSKDVWQIRLIRNYMGYIVENRRYNGLFSNELVSAFIEQCQTEIEYQIRNDKMISLLRQFISTRDFCTISQQLNHMDVMTLIIIIVFYNLVPNSVPFVNKSSNFISYLQQSSEQNSDPLTTLFLINILGLTNLETSILKN